MNLTRLKSSCQAQNEAFGQNLLLDPSENISRNRSFLHRKVAKIQSVKGQKPSFACPFQSTATAQVDCNKPGGVCSLRLYEKSPATGEVTAAQGEAGQLRTICPQR